MDRLPLSVWSHLSDSFHFANLILIYLLYIYIVHHFQFHHRRHLSLHHAFTASVPGTSTPLISSVDPSLRRLPILTAWTPGFHGLLDFAFHMLVGLILKSYVSLFQFTKLLNPSTYGSTYDC